MPTGVYRQQLQDQQQNLETWKIFYSFSDSRLYYPRAWTDYRLCCCRMSFNNTSKKMAISPKAAFHLCPGLISLHAGGQGKKRTTRGTVLKLASRMPWMSIAHSWPLLVTMYCSNYLTLIIPTTSKATTKLLGDDSPISLVTDNEELELGD